MRIPRVYQDTGLTSGNQLLLEAGASQHLLKVLRLRDGASLIIFDGRGVSYSAILLGNRAGRAEIELQSPLDENTQSPLRLHVGLGISKGERMDYAIQKLVETGVHEITPLLTEHTVVKLDARRAQSRLQHWQGIIIGACEQCGRNILPELHTVTAVGDWLQAEQAGCRLLFDAEGDERLQSIPAPDSLCVLIGPEGGLSAAEREQAKTRGFRAVRLGPRILRAETAAVAISAALQTLWGDF